MNMAAVKVLAGLIAKKRSLEESLRSVKDEIADMEPEIISDMIDNQIDRMPVRVGDDSVTIYIHRQLWAKPKDGDKDEVVRVLKRCGMADFVQENYNTNSLSAYVRERLGTGQQLQPTLRDALHLDEVVSIRGRRSPASSDSKTAKAMKTLRR